MYVSDSDCFAEDNNFTAFSCVSHLTITSPFSFWRTSFTEKATGSNLLAMSALVVLAVWDFLGWNTTVCSISSILAGFSLFGSGRLGSVGLGFLRLPDHRNI